MVAGLGYGEVIHTEDGISGYKVDIIYKGFCDRDQYLFFNILNIKTLNIETGILLVTLSRPRLQKTQSQHGEMSL